MASLAQLQAAAFRAIGEGGGPPCFLKLCQTDDALWVSDLPRKGSLEGPEAALNRLGLCCRLEPRTKLWKLDASPERYAAWQRELPQSPPALPRGREAEEVYALCRLLLLHPAPLESQPMEWVRGALKRQSAPLKELRSFAVQAHAACARLLGEGRPLPSMAGGLLALWLESDGPKGGTEECC